MKMKQEYIDRALDFYKENLTEHMMVTPKEECWIIRYKGVQLKMESGKSSWKKIGHAKNALWGSLASISFGNKMFKDIDWRMLNDLQYLVRDLIVKDLVEFINIAKEVS